MAETLGGILSELQRITLENTIDQGTTWSSLWTPAEVIHYLNQRIARFLVETELVQVGNVTAGSSGGNPVINLPADLITLKRVTTSVDPFTDHTVLPPTDRWAADLGAFAALDAQGRPTAYIQEPQTPLQITLVPTPAVATSSEFIYVPQATTYTTGTSKATVLPIPDAFTPYLLFGVLADMFSKEGEANDPDRALYFDERWQEGIELGKLVLR